MTQEDLVAACQSDKIAASRAMTQNQSLKKQLEELETAVVQTTNSKASIASELDNLKRKTKAFEEAEKATSLELKGLREAVRERDRSIGQLREQIKYYINFAENSIHGHLDGKPRNTTAQHEQQVERLVKELQEAKETIRCLNSHNSELKSQLEVLAQRTRENSETTPTTTTRSNGGTSGAGTPEHAAGQGDEGAKTNGKMTPASGATTSAAMASSG